MSSNSNCCCGGTSTASPCDTAIAELPRYYPRQLITPDDLTLEQNYFRDRMRRHNRLLHGWGVVCGALVCPATKTNADGTIVLVPYNVVVQTGYILGPYGDEIILDCQRTVDLRTSGVSGVTGDACLDAPDPWCTQVYQTPSSSTNTLYIAVQYKQSMMRPVRVQPAGCGCTDTSCEFSRWHDGYEIGVLSQCPSCTQAPTSSATQGLRPSSRTGQTPVGTNLPAIDLTSNPTCPDCSCGPWVGLAVVTFNQSGNILTIDNCACRRIVTSLSQAYRSCTGLVPTVTSVTPTSLSSGATIWLTATGTGFYCGTKAAFAATDPIQVVQTNVQDSQTLNLAVNVATSATGTVNATLTVTNMDGQSSAAFEQSFTVGTGSAPAPPTNVTAQTHTSSRASRVSQKSSKSD